MKPWTIVSLFWILGAVSVAWIALSLSTEARTEALDASLSLEMNSLWGPRALVQEGPYWSPDSEADRGGGKTVGPSGSEVSVRIAHEHRYKGLLWYSTFRVDFAGTYEVAESGGGKGFFVFPLPDGVRTYHDLSASVDGANAPIPPEDIARGRLTLGLSGDRPHTVSVRYRAGGRDAWLYSAGGVPYVEFVDGAPVVGASDRLVEARDLDVAVRVDFQEIDYPRGTLGPTVRAVEDGDGMRAEWSFGHLISSQALGIAMPVRPNAGPIVARMTRFAPVSLFFFFTVLATIVILKRIPLHAAHFVFIAAGFFSFHVLQSYLADLVDLHLSFWISAAVSVFLVVSYMRLVAGIRFALTWVALAQLVYLVGFSYAFFWKGRTGLTIVLGAIGTLFLVMQATGRLDWSKAMGALGKAPPPKPAEEPGGA